MAAVELCMRFKKTYDFLSYQDYHIRAGDVFWIRGDMS